MEDHQAFRRKGQTLAEFALTLPILLILLFGIIEFGRLFQAWVTLQNSARAATRYATTGNYDTSKYNIDTVVPCVTTDLRGTRQQLPPDPSVPLYKIDQYKGGNESLFATWYDGADCDPGSDNDQERRKDLLRITSVMDEARRGAAGLSLPPNPIQGTLPSVTDVLYSVWDRPLKGSSDKGWFNVMICSARAFTNEKSISYQEANGGSASTAAKTRFLTVLDPVQIYGGNKWEYPVPFCMMNEVQPAIANATDNAGKRWLDPGGPGDQITVVVTFNHPLITPLGLTQYVQIQTRRTAVNESFRASRAILSPQGSSPLGGSFDTPTPLPPSDTPLPPTKTPKPPTNTPIPPSPTATVPPPFDCDLITVSDVSFFTNRVFIQITNDNAQATSLERVRLNWSTLTDYPGMFVNVMSVNSEAHWLGKDAVPNTDSIAAADNQDPALPGNIPGSDRSVFGFGTVVTWEGVFNNGPASVGQYMTPWTFSGTIFTFYNVINPAQPCEKVLYLPPQPSNTPTLANQPSPTKTFTPNCASNQLQVSFVSFDAFGVVRLQVQNQRAVVAPFTGFSLVWIQRSAGVLRLDKVTVGGSNPDDATSVVVWRGGTSPTFGGDTAPNSVSGALNTQTADGMWVSNYTFPPNSTTTLYLDFGGTSSTLSSAFGVAPSDYNGSNFIIGCGATGGATSGTGGSTSSGPIFLNNVPTPVPTNTPPPTNTPGPTLTASKTYTPAPPTLTKTKAPPTNTITPAPPTKTPAPTTVPLPTQPGTGGSG